MEKLTSLSEAHPVKISVSQGSEWDLRVAEAHSLSILLDCAMKLERDGWCGKMSPRLYQAGTEKILQPSSHCSQDGISPSLKADGVSVESSPLQTDTLVYPTEYLTLSIPEFPNFHELSRSEGSVSSLSDILVTGSIPARYYLSVKCAEGILRRAERRGRTLPEVLKAALIRQSQSASAAENQAVARGH